MSGKDTQNNQADSMIVDQLACRNQNDKSEKTSNIEQQAYLTHLYNSVPSLQGSFRIIRKVGEGTFSKVYLAELCEFPNQFFALKHVVPTSSPKRVENELRCLRELGGQHNVIEVRACIRHQDNIVLVMPYIRHERFQDYINIMSVSDTREYIRNLFIALKHVHSYSIIHRDIKPSNFLLSKDTGRYFLLDFGLAEKVSNVRVESQKENDQPMNVLDCSSFHGSDHVCNICMSRKEQKTPREGTPGFRSPEVLLKYPYQTTAVDIWSAGVVLLSILSGHYPFFKAEDDMTAIAQIMSITGSRELISIAKTYGKSITSNPEIPALDLKTVCTKLRRNNNHVALLDANFHKRITNIEASNEIEFPDSAYDLVRRCLDLNSETRITAAEALNHAFLKTDSRPL